MCPGPAHYQYRCAHDAPQPDDECYNGGRGCEASSGVSLRLEQSKTTRSNCYFFSTHSEH